MSIQTLPPSERRQNSMRTAHRVVRRRGLLVVMLLFLMVIGVLAAALAINWAYLVTVYRHHQHSIDAIALAATPALLDEDLLRDSSAGQADDVGDAIAIAHTYRELGNTHVSARLKLEEADITVTPGYVANADLRHGDFDFVEAAPYNTLRIVAYRPGDGSHPVEHLTMAATIDPADMISTTYAMLDNRVIGFCPRPGMASPVVPLAIEQSAFAARADLDNNCIREMVLLFQPHGAPTPAANCALVDLGGLAINLNRILNQIEAGGIEATELPGGKLGPAGNGPQAGFPENPDSLRLPAMFASPNISETDALVVAFNAIAQSDNPKRIFPVYSNFASGKVEVVGFVAGRILGAMNENIVGPPDHHRLKIVIEPCFMIHATAWTSSQAAEENLFVHKLRLLR